MLREQPNTRAISLGVSGSSSCEAIAFALILGGVAFCTIMAGRFGNGKDNGAL